MWLENRLVSVALALAVVLSACGEDSGGGDVEASSGQGNEVGGGGNAANGGMPASGGKNMAAGGQAVGGSGVGNGGQPFNRGGSANAGGSVNAGGQTGAGGSANLGGSVNAGGQTTGSGGVQNAGGSVANGGLDGIGGILNSGGTEPNGGAEPNGGSTSDTGGATSGGSPAQGGVANAGGDQNVGGTGGIVTTPPAFVNTYDGARPTTESLDFDWRFYLGDASGAENPSFDDASWTAIDVPHDWSITLPFNQSSAASFGGGYLDGGLGWYRKSFSLPVESSGQKIYVQFDGVYMDSTVWLNGTEVCARPYGYSSFECDITNDAEFGATNVLAVRVNNQLPSSRWYSGSGIYRHVWLKTVNPVHVAYTGVHVTTPQISAESATVSIKASVRNDTAGSQSVTVQGSIRDAAGTEVGTVTSPEQSINGESTVDVEMTGAVPSPQLWSVSSPTMYTVITTVSVDGEVVDTYKTPLGIRSFSFDANSGFSLNGQPMKLNGVCNHHDLGALGAAVNHRAIEKRLQMLKEMGANAIRTSHNPPAPEMLDFADRMGFLVVDEAFDMWYGAKTDHDYARFFREWADTDMKDFVARDRNHPSVIIWSIGNEIAQAGDRAVVQQLIDAIHSMDQTRVTAQAYAAWVGIDSLTGLEDVVGINYAPDRYDSVHSDHPDWKLFASESSSAFKSRGIYNNNDTQASSYDNFAAGWGHTAETSWENVNTRPWIAGEFIWTGFDYIGEPTPYEWPAKSSYFGIIDTANLPKDIFYFYQSKWNADGPPMVHIVPMDWTSWGSGSNVRVFAYSNADSVELLLNGESLGSKDVDPAQGHLEWSVRFATGTLEARATKDGTVVATDQVQTAGSAASLVLNVDRGSIAADGRDLAFVEVSVVDAQGVVVPQASNLIDFTIDGPGKIVGVDNGNAISHESYKGTSRSAFSGKAVAIVQASTTPGDITLSAASGGLTGGSVPIVTTAP